MLESISGTRCEEGRKSLLFKADRQDNQKYLELLRTRGRTRRPGMSFPWQPDAREPASAPGDLYPPLGREARTKTYKQLTRGPDTPTGPRGHDDDRDGPADPDRARGRVSSQTGPRDGQICFLRSDRESVVSDGRLRRPCQIAPLDRPIRPSPKINPSSDCPLGLSHHQTVPSDHEFKKIVINQVLAAALPYAVYHAHCPRKRELRITPFRCGPECGPLAFPNAYLTTLPASPGWCWRDGAGGGWRGPLSFSRPFSPLTIEAGSSSFPRTVPPDKGARPTISVGFLRPPDKHKARFELSSPSLPNPRTQGEGNRARSAALGRWHQSPSRDERRLCVGAAMALSRHHPHEDRLPLPSPACKASATPPPANDKTNTLRKRENMLVKQALCEGNYHNAVGMSSSSPYSGNTTNTHLSHIPVTGHQLNPHSPQAAIAANGYSPPAPRAQQGRLRVMQESAEAARHRRPPEWNV
ncbi:hypothetical protein C7M84_005458 [Penaeus vannamei]|uniref:Uncharacterized protein n=1 Tax=Penaeus vannamei TaxID=6689 RepID=A0A3R7QRW9_PENVA|nr:hypothetical protein C7M84_005458 [Penaeus vannamei]